MQSDPIGLAGGTNTFAYVGGNPTRYTDQLGLARNTVEAALQQAILEGNVEEVQVILDVSPGLSLEHLSLKPQRMQTESPTFSAKRHTIWTL